MTITEARTTPVPDTVILTHRILKAKVAAARADQDAAQAISDAAEARAHLETLQAEHRALLGLAA